MTNERTPTGKKSCKQHGPVEMYVAGGRNKPRWECRICRREWLREKSALRNLGLAVAESLSPAHQLAIEMRMSLLYDVWFTCAHSNTFPHPCPEVGEVMHCNYCGEWKQVVRVAEGRRRKSKTKAGTVGKT